MRKSVYYKQRGTYDGDKIFYMVCTTEDLLNTKRFKPKRRDKFTKLKELFDIKGESAERKANRLSSKIVNRFWQIMISDIIESGYTFADPYPSMLTMRVNNITDIVKKNTYGKSMKFDIETLGNMYGIEFGVSSRISYINKFKRYYVKLGKLQQKELNENVKNYII